MKKLAMGAMMVAGLAFSGAALALGGFGQVNYFFPAGLRPSILSVSFSATDVYFQKDPSQMDQPTWSVTHVIPRANCGQLNSCSWAPITAQMQQSPTSTAPIKTENVIFNGYIDHGFIGGIVPSKISALSVITGDGTFYVKSCVVNNDPATSKANNLYIDIFSDTTSAAALTDCQNYEQAAGKPASVCDSSFVSADPSVTPRLAYAIVNNNS